MNEYIWLALLGIFLVAEAACPIHLVSIWFALGALAAMIAAMAEGSLTLQVVLFFAVSAVMLLAMWPLTRKYLKPRITPTNIDAIIGCTGRVTVTIRNEDAQGQVKLGAMEWTARSTTGAPIEEGTLVMVDKIEGVKIFVTPV